MKGDFPSPLHSEGFSSCKGGGCSRRWAAAGLPALHVRE